MVNAFKYFQVGLNSTIYTMYSSKTLSDYLVSGKWCIADKAYSRKGNSYANYTYELLGEDGYEYNYYGFMFHDSYVRLEVEYQPTLKCTGKVLNNYGDNITPMYVGTLTADEAVYVGMTAFDLSYDNYLVDNYKSWWWTLTPSFYGYYDDFYYIYYIGRTLDHRGIQKYPISFRLAINLKAGVSIGTGGNGTKDNPYVIK